MTAYKSNPDIENHREKKEDRRSFGPSTQFPFVDSIDKVIKKDRRFMPDRRIANIHVTSHFQHIKRMY